MGQKFSMGEAAEGKGKSPSGQKSNTPVLPNLLNNASYQ